MTPSPAAYGEAVAWQPERPRFKPLRLLLSWALTAASLWVAAAILPGVDIVGFGGALLVALVVALLNALLPPVLAALRLPFMLVLGFVLVLILNAFVLEFASRVLDNTFAVDDFGWALLAALVVAAVSVVLEVIFGTNDDDTYTLRVVQRIARRQGGATRTEVPGIIFLEIDGLALPVLRRAMRDGNATTMARWLSEGTHRLTEWETDLSSQTGASQAGILLGSNDDIPAFRWVDKESGKLTACSNPADCARIEAERATGIGLLVDGGSSRGNLLSGEAEAVILTVSRMEAEKRANPGYRAFFANGFNVTRALVLFGWEVILEWTAALRGDPSRRAPERSSRRHLPVPARRDVRDRPRPDRVRRAHGRDARTPGHLRHVLELRRGRAPLGARAGGHAGGAPQARRAVRSHRARAALRAASLRDRRALGPRADAGRDVQAAQRLRARRARRALARARNRRGGRRRRRAACDGRARGRRGYRPDGEHAGGRTKHDVSDKHVIVLGSGNLGLISLMEEPRRLTLEEIDERHPRLIPALRAHPHIGWLLVRSSERGPVALGPAGAHYLADGTIEEEDPLAPFAPNAPRHLLRTDGFAHVADIMVGSFYDPDLEEGCAFEELICVPRRSRRTADAAVHPLSRRAPAPRRATSSAPSSVHSVLSGWRQLLQGGGAGRHRRRLPPMNLLWSALVIVVAAALAVTTMLLVRRRAPEGSRFKDGDRASGVFGVLATGFSVLLGFVVFLAFESYDQSRSGAETEALVVSQQVETAQYFRAPVARKLTGELVCYGRSVVHIEWPRAESGVQGDAINPWGVRLFRTFETVRPQTPSEDAAYGKWIDQTSDREAARIDRIHGATGVIPTPLWLVLFLISGSRLRVHAVLRRQR